MMGQQKENDIRKSINYNWHTFFDYFSLISLSIHTRPFPCIDCKKTNYAGVFMKDYIEERAVEIAYYIIENKATVRQTAVAFGVSKSTIHKDVTERLLQINPSLAGEARKVLDLNKSERHIRGGLATREKYLHQERR